jgi:replicative DNA helicase
VCSNLSLTAAAQLTPVLYVSTEMTDAQSAWRMLMLESGLNDQRIRRRQMVAAHERGQILEAETRLRAMPIAFAGMPTLAQLRSHIRRFATLNVRAGQTGLVIVDHMGDVRIPGFKGSRAEEVEETMRAVKELVQRLPIHVLYVVHANREGSKNGLSLNTMLNGGEYARRADNALILEPVRKEGGEWVTISRQEAAQDRVSGELMLRCLVLKARHGYESTTMLRQNWKLGGAITEVEA